MESVSNDKWLLHLLKGMSPRTIFFSVWLVIAGFFVLLILAYYKKMTRRNFKEDNMGLRQIKKTGTSLMVRPDSNQLPKKGQKK